MNLLTAIPKISETVDQNTTLCSTHKCSRHSCTRPIPSNPSDQPPIKSSSHHSLDVATFDVLPTFTEIIFHFLYKNYYKIQSGNKWIKKLPEIIPEEAHNVLNKIKYFPFGVCVPCLGTFPVESTYYYNIKSITSHIYVLKNMPTHLQLLQDPPLFFALLGEIVTLGCLLH